MFLYFDIAKFYFTKTDLDHEPERGDRREAEKRVSWSIVFSTQTFTNVGLGISNLDVINFVDQDIRKPGPEGGQFK